MSLTPHFDQFPIYRLPRQHYHHHHRQHHHDHHPTHLIGATMDFLDMEMEPQEKKRKGGRGRAVACGSRKDDHAKDLARRGNRSPTPPPLPCGRPAGIGSSRRTPPPCGKQVHTGCPGARAEARAGCASSERAAPSADLDTPLPVVGVGPWSL